mgnify:CR=1 FL=1
MVGNNYSLRTVPTIVEHAMEVGVQRAVMRMRPWGYLQEEAKEEKEKEEKEEEEGVGLSFEI